MSTQEEKTTSTQKVHRQMTIDDIFTTFPHRSQQLSQEMTNFGLHCVGCHASTWETLEAGMMGHGMNDEQIEDLITRLNKIIEEKLDATTVSITPKAAEKYLAILEEEGKLGWGLRLGEKLGGCNGFEYQLDYAEAADPEDDKIFISQGMEIYINKNSLDRLLGLEIDYVDGLYGAGFKISNPNVSSSCSCGTSHGY